MPDNDLDQVQTEASAAPVDSAGPHLQNDGTAVDGARQRIRRLPPEVGAVLIAVGVVGVILPGPIGTPLLLAGGLALLPSVFGRLDRWVEKRSPTLHGRGMSLVDRFIDDLEKRFPPEPQADEMGA
jgi:hypothetical protein